VFAHFVALAFPSVILLPQGLPTSLSGAWSARCLAFRDLICPSLSFHFARRGLHGLGFDALSRCCLLTGLPTIQLGQH
jgi:hypothetical protein